MCLFSRDLPAFRSGWWRAGRGPAQSASGDTLRKAVAVPPPDATTSESRPRRAGQGPARKTIQRKAFGIHWSCTCAKNATFRYDTSVISGIQE